MHDRCAPTSEGFAGQCKRNYSRVPGKKGMDGLSELADSFAVDDPHSQDTARPARFQVIWHQLLDLPGLESMQIQDPING